jgi:hypothetical protein
MNPDQEYIKGYNDGYLLSKHEPKLAENITPALKGRTDYDAGFAEGHEAAHKERTLEQLKQMRNRGKDKEIDHDR